MSLRYILTVAIVLATQSATLVGEEKPTRHRILLAEYGKGPNRLIEVSKDGKLVWEHRPPKRVAN